jgi:hypothetical protein
VVDYLQKVFGQNNVAIAYIYCNYKEHIRQTVSELIASLLKQLVQGSPATSDSAKSLYQRHTPQNTRPTIAELIKTLQSEIRTYSKVFIIVDALDECLEGNGGHLIRVLQSLTDAVNLMVTARPLPLIEQQFLNAIRLDIRANDNDVRQYVEDRIPREPRLVQLIGTDQALQDSIVNKIVEKVGGMYVFPMSLSPRMTGC